MKPTPSLAQTLQETLLAFALVFPWVTNIVGGPTPGVQPWLISALCATLVWWSRRSLDARWVALCWTAAAVLNACAALAQYFGHAGALAPWVAYGNIGDAYGNLRQRNQFATLTSIGLSALLWQATQWRDTLGLRRVLPLLVCATLLALGNAASGSRTGFVQWLGIALLALLWRRSLPRRALELVLGALAAYLLASWLLPLVLAAVTQVHSSGALLRLDEADGCHGRAVLWSNVLQLIAQKPWFGWGWGELIYAHATTLYPGARFCEILDNAHNLPLHIAVSLGLPAALALCALLLWGLWRGKPWAETDSTRQMAWAVLAVIGLHSLLEYPLWYGPFQIATGLALWLLLQRKALPAGVKKLHKNPTPSRMATHFIALFLIASCSYALWDYWRISQIFLPQPQRSPAYQEDTLRKIQDSWLFADQVRYAELAIIPITPSTASHARDLALRTLHFSPEALVMAKLVQCDAVLNLQDEGIYYLQRFASAYPQEYAQWLQQTGQKP